MPGAYQRAYEPTITYYNIGLTITRPMKIGQINTKQESFKICNLAFKLLRWNPSELRWSFERHEGGERKWRDRTIDKLNEPSDCGKLIADVQVSGRTIRKFRVLNLFEAISFALAHVYLGSPAPFGAPPPKGQFVDCTGHKELNEELIGTNNSDR